MFVVLPQIFISLADFRPLTHFSKGDVLHKLSLRCFLKTENLSVFCVVSESADCSLTCL